MWSWIQHGKLHQTRQCMAVFVFAAMCIDAQLVPCCRKVRDAAPAENRFQLCSCQLDHSIREVLPLTAASRYVYAWIHNVENLVLGPSQKHCGRHDPHVALLATGLSEVLPSCLMLQRLPSPPPSIAAASSNPCGKTQLVLLNCDESDVSVIPKKKKDTSY